MKQELSELARLVEWARLAGEDLGRCTIFNHCLPGWPWVCDRPISTIAILIQACTSLLGRCKTQHCNSFYSYTLIYMGGK